MGRRTAPGGPRVTEGTGPGAPLLTVPRPRRRTRRRCRGTRPSSRRRASAARGRRAPRQRTARPRRTRRTADRPREADARGSAHRAAAAAVSRPRKAGRRARPPGGRSRAAGHRPGRLQHPEDVRGVPALPRHPLTPSVAGPAARRRWQGSHGAWTLQGTGPNARYVERNRLAGPDRLHYEFAEHEWFVGPWTVTFPITRAAGPVFENGCLGGNDSMPLILGACPRRGTGQAVSCS